MNTGAHVSFSIRVLSRYMPRSGIAVVATLFLVFKGKSILYSMEIAPIYIPTNSIRRENH